MKDLLAAYLRSQADWRRSIAERYPDDPRNLQSAAALDSLAEHVMIDEDVDRLVEPLEPFLREDAFGGERTAREVARYGYGYKVGPAQHDAFLEELWASCMMDAYDAAADLGEDAYGVLEPAEVEAARNHILVPESYWERRPMLHEHEIEEWIASYSEADEDA